MARMRCGGTDGFRLGLAQMRVAPGEPELNLDRATWWMEVARDQGVDLLLLPEALDCGWTHPSAVGEAGAIPGGRAFERLRGKARSLGIWACAGLVERCGGRLYNAAALIGPDGGLRLHHRKIHELDFARALYSTGDRLGVAETPFGRLGLMICADGFAPGLVLSRALAAMGARGILSPCAWAVRPDHDPMLEPYGKLWLESYGPVARERGIWIAGCSNVGPVTAGEWRGWRCIGCSLVVGAEGQPMVRGPYGEAAEALLVLDLPGSGGGADPGDLGRAG